MPRVFGWSPMWMSGVMFLLAAEWFIFQAIRYLHRVPVDDIFLEIRSSRPQKMISSREKLITPGYEDAPDVDYPRSIPKSFTEGQITTAPIVKNNWLKGAPTAEYEKTRRRLVMVTREFWFFMESRLEKLKENLSGNHTAGQIEKVLEESLDYKRSMLHEVSKLSKVDGHSSWRYGEAAALSDLVQQRLISLQNPSDCREARKLICHIHKKCGFGCQVHHLVYCLITAYSSRRTMILRSSGWKYNHVGWESVFLPVSNTCTFGKKDPWPYDDYDVQAQNPHSTSQVVDLPIVESQRHKYLPLAVPKDLVGRISHLHEVPALWWVSQFVKYLMKLQPKTKQMIDNAALILKFRLPIVGVHIRRTDKLYHEAENHTVEEYMSHVEEYYKQLSTVQTVDKKRIYLASDDASVFEEINSKYSDYDVVGSVNISLTAKESRYSSESLDGLLVDLYLLAYSDFLVCTFSSQVCRLAYEMMQNLHPDATNRFRSLDDIYYFGGGGMHRVVAVMNHTSSSTDQMNLTVGDYVKLVGNEWNGYSVGRNLRTDQVGMFPSFKVDDVVEALDFPWNYAHLPRKYSQRLSSDKTRFPLYDSELIIFSRKNFASPE